MRDRCGRTKNTSGSGCPPVSGHIACDGGSNSEIVVPMLLDGKVIGVIDLDSYSFDRFDEREQQALEKIAQLLVQQCDWNNLDAQ